MRRLCLGMLQPRWPRPASRAKPGAEPQRLTLSPPPGRQSPRHAGNLR